MDTSLAHENARLRALLQTQQDTIRQMAEYNRLLSQRVAAYASEINRLKALVAKLQRMQFGKSSEKLRAKTERQIQEAQERISALQEEMAETLGEQYDPVLPSALRQSSARKPLPASLPRETRVIPGPGKRNAVLPVVVNSVLWDVMCQSNWSLSAAPLRLSKHNVRNRPVAGATISCRHQYLQNPLHAVMPERGFWPMLSPGNMQTICRYTASQKYTVVREWS
ncbi:putative transposase [Escherichia coli EPECa14]|nr:putative transposase [Escherichia coli EPECa14]